MTEKLTSTGPEATWEKTLSTGTDVAKVDQTVEVGVGIQARAAMTSLEIVVASFKRESSHPVLAILPTGTKGDSKNVFRTEAVFQIENTVSISL